MRRTTVALMLWAGLVLAGTSSAWAGEPVYHDPWLNWNLLNMTGVAVNDLELVVDDPVYSPNALDPTQVMMGPFAAFNVAHLDFDLNGDTDTVLTWSGGVVNPGIVAHIGLYMKDSGKVLDGFWTLNGVKQGGSAVFTYEKTKIVGDPEVHMILNISPGFYADPYNSGHEAGWTNIRTFRNIPADVLDLEDLNETLILGDLAGYEVTPRRGGPTGEEILLTDVILMPDAESFFDVFLDTIPLEKAGPDFESLLVATVVIPGSPTPPGMFWNLNPQSPEPATVSLLVLGGLGMLIRRRR